MKQKG